MKKVLLMFGLLSFVLVGSASALTLPVAPQFPGNGNAYGFFNAYLGPLNSREGWQSGGFDLVYSFRQIPGLGDFLDNLHQWPFGSGFDTNNHFWNNDVCGPAKPVPEPATMTLFGLGLLGLLGFRKPTN